MEYINNMNLFDKLFKKLLLLLLLFIINIFNVTKVYCC